MPRFEHVGIWETSPAPVAKLDVVVAVDFVAKSENISEQLFPKLFLMRRHLDGIDVARVVQVVEDAGHVGRVGG